MHQKKFDTAFENWITKNGLTEIARILGTNRTTVWHWKAGKVLPRASQMKQIKELTRGKIGYTQIIDGSCSPLNK